MDDIDDLIKRFELVEVILKEEGDFLKVKETLSRIGIPEEKDGVKKLHQSCHILHKRGRYFLVHFKELFSLDGKETYFSLPDKGRRNTIINLLQEWGLLKIKDESLIKDPRAPMSVIKVIAFKYKGNWELCAKYTIGKKRRKPRDDEWGDED